jgi:hypothetical protein
LKFITYDANFTDGSDLSKMLAIYEYRGQIARIPANTPLDQVNAAVYAELEMDAQAETTRTLDLTDVAEQAAAALIQIDDDLTGNATDLALLPTATNAQLKDIVGRMLAREKRLLQRQRRIVKAIRHFAD